MRSIPLVNIGWIESFLEILEEVGAPCEEILRAAGLPELSADDGSVLVPTAGIYQFVDLAGQATGLVDLGFRAGSRIGIEMLIPDVGDPWRRPGVFSTIDNFIEVVLESSSNVDMWIERRSDRGKTIEFFYRGTFGPERPAFETVEQFMVAVMVRLVRHAAGRDWFPEQVDFRAASVPEQAVRKLVGEARVRCSQTSTSIRFPGKRWADSVEPFPVKSASAWKPRRQSRDKWIQGDDLAGSLRLLLQAYLPDGAPDIKLAARLTGTTVRTLQRRLAEQGTSYSHLVEDLRHDLALYRLRDSSVTVAEVSRELGYRDPAIFTRAFSRWTGQTPSQFRRTNSVS